MIDAALNRRLAASAELAVLVGGALFPNMVPKSPPAKYVWWRLGDAAQLRTLKSSLKNGTAVVGVQAVAPTYPELRELVDVLRTLLDDWQDADESPRIVIGRLIGPQIGVDPETEPPAQTATFNLSVRFILD